MSYTYLQGQEEESSEVYCWDTDPCALLKSSPIHERFCSNGKETESCLDSQYGTTSAPSTANPGMAKSMSFAEDSLARTSVPQEKEKGSMESEAEFTKFDLDTSSWKTHQQSLFGGWDQFSETWPKWGLMQDGECLALKTPEAVMQGNGSGVLPTPCTSDYKGGTNKPQKSNGKLRTHQYKHWNKILFGLMYPIPEHMEAMMGWPIEWSALKPLEMDKFQQWQQQHGGF
jgi:hypothetical protein